MAPGRIIRDNAAGLALPAILLCAMALRIAAWMVLSPAIESDGLSYVTMAQSLVTDGVLRDNFGQHVFYSAGYPLLLAPAFALAGPGSATVLAVNCALAAVTGLLLYRLIHALGAARGAALMAVALFAAWLPAIWNATLPARENLSAPLLLGLLLSALALARGTASPWTAFAGGLCWGAGAVTGGSSILAGAAVAVALACLVLAGRKALAARSALAFTVGALLTLGPWLVASERLVGEPMLNSNAEFNLYLGNNPSATGSFVSIADTPAGPEWEARRRELGEAGSAHWLGGMARDWIAENPGEAVRLALVKLGRFWMPNLPDAADFAASKPIAMIRFGDVAEYLLVFSSAAFALWRSPVPVRDRLVLASLIGGFWLVHAAAYVMPRYRDPLAPVLIALAACWAWPLLARRKFPRPAHAA